MATVTNFGQYGLDLGTDAVLAAGNFVGTDSSGSPGMGNAIGILMSGASGAGGNDPAERNIVSGNQVGIYVNGSGATIQGNYIGTDPSGTSAIRTRRACS